jgi:hypothetical protein
MQKPAILFASLSLPLLLAGCYVAGPVPVDLKAEAPNSSVATWRMPWQLNPISPQSASFGEKTKRIYVEGTGYVRGTPAALASIGRHLEPAAGVNHTVEVCRGVVEGEADKLGAKQVEAVSAGPDHLNANGQWVGQVYFRINYQRAGGYEIRQATLTCIVGQDNKIIDAYAAGSRRAEAQARTAG